MKTVKAFGIAALAMLTVSAFAAASASALEFKSTASPVTFRGVMGAGQSSVWVTQGLKSKCTGAEWESASTATPVKVISLAPIWSGCTNFEFSEEKSVNVVNGCKFELLEPPISLESNVAIRCPTGESIWIHGESIFSTCEVRIGEAGNTNLAKAPLKNLGGSPSKFEVSFQVVGITAEVTASTGLCGMVKGVRNNVTYTAQVNIEDKAVKAGVSIG